MADFIDIPIGPIEKIEDAIRKVEEFAKDALALAVQPIQDTVRDLTPRHKGGLVRNVLTREEQDGRDQVVFGEGIVMLTHEHNGQWTKLPPHKPILSWVESKLGKAGKEAESAAWAVRYKIKARGLTLPNKEGRGQMFQRGFERMRDSGAHYVVFKSAMKRLAMKERA